jgi:hypothetical protein
MAFNNDNFASVGAHSTDTPTLWSYQTTDSIAIVTTNNYFYEKRFQLMVGDIIYVHADNMISQLMVIGLSPVATGDVMAKDFYIEVAKGNVAGHSAINKFGHSPTAPVATAIAPQDVWGGAGLYDYYPTEALAVSIASTDDTEDNVGGDGALTVTVQGLGENWEVVEETVTMTGDTPAPLTQKFIRLYRAFVRTSGADATNAGDIVVHETADDSNVGIFITAGHGQTQQCNYTIPANTTAFFIKGYVGLSVAAQTAKTGTFRWMLRVNAFGAGGAWLTQGEVGLINSGNSYWKYKYGVPAGAILEKTDMKIQLSLSNFIMDIVGGYDLVLVEAGY